jgi:hypothetical protein
MSRLDSYRKKCYCEFTICCASAHKEFFMQSIQAANDERLPPEKSFRKPVPLPTAEILLDFFLRLKKAEMEESNVLVQESICSIYPSIVSALSVCATLKPMAPETLESIREIADQHHMLIWQKTISF